MTALNYGGSITIDRKLAQVLLEESVAEATIRVFYSYSRRDQDLREKLDQHLAPLKFAGFIKPWYDLLLEPGSDWKQGIGNQLDTADIILLLVSANFLSSEYCYSIELKRALERDARQETCVIPIILEPCDWKRDWVPFSKLTALPNHEKAITEWDNREKAFASVAKSIGEKVTTLRQQQQVAEQEQQRLLAQRVAEQEAEQKQLRQAEEQERLRQAEQLRQQQAEAERLKQEEQERQRQERLKQEAEKKRQQEQANQPSPDALKGNYAQLEALLKASKWKEADQETNKQMLRVMGREKEGWLRVEDIQEFPCADLHKIDQLWKKYSNGHFGFSVQKQIWQECGSPKEYNSNWEKFGDRVGWRTKGFLGFGSGRKSYSELTFDTSAPEGHLTTPYGKWGVGCVWVV